MSAIAQKRIVRVMSPARESRRFKDFVVFYETMLIDLPCTRVSETFMLGKGAKWLRVQECKILRARSYAHILVHKS